MKPRSHHRGLALLSCVMLSASPSAHAATYTWTGADSNWRSAYSWNAGIVPVADDSLILTGSGNLTSSNSIAANTVFRNLTFNSSASAFTVRGNDFGITGSITNASANLQSISAKVASQSTLTLVASGKGNLTFFGVVSGAAVTVNSTGSGVVGLNTANTYTGATTVRAGVLNIRNATSLGTVAGATTVANSAALQIQNNITVGAEALSLSGTGVSSTGALRNISGNNTYGGLVTLGAASRINSDAGSLSISNAGTITGDGLGLTVGGEGNTSIASIIGTGAGTLTKDGTGSLTLSGANTYTGGTTVSSGSLIVNGSLANTALAVQTGALLGGSGSIGSGEALVAIQSGGSLSPGNSPGMLTVNGSLTLSLGSSYDYQLTSGSVLADSVDVNGALILGDAALILTNLGTYVANQRFTLFAYESLTGTFIGLADDTTFTAGGGDWLINYNDTTGGLNTEAVGTSYVTITAVPEPSALALLGLGTLGLIARRRRTA